MENSTPTQVSKLNNILDRLINTLLPKTSRNKSFFVNDIPDYFHLKKESPALTAVLGGLLCTIVSNTKECCIWLSARLYGNVVLVHVKNSSIAMTQAIEGELMALESEANKNKGAIGFTSHQANITSVTFSFYQ